MAGGRVDRELDRYLVPGERVVAVVQQHWFSQLRPVVVFVAVIVLATFVEGWAPQTRSGAMIANASWYAVFAVGAYLLWRFLNWRNDWFIATDKRFLLFYGLIRREVAMMPLMKVTDMTFNRSILGRILGYGGFVLESAGQDQALSNITYVPHAERHYRAICTELFGTEPVRDPEDGWVEADDPGDSSHTDPGRQTFLGAGRRWSPHRPEG